jgi:hypothetical protein
MKRKEQKIPKKSIWNEGVLRSIYEDIKAHTFIDKFIGVELWCMLNLSASES